MKEHVDFVKNPRPRSRAIFESFVQHVLITNVTVTWTINFTYVKGTKSFLIVLYCLINFIPFQILLQYASLNPFKKICPLSLEISILLIYISTTWKCLYKAMKIILVRYEVSFIKLSYFDFWVLRLYSCTTILMFLYINIKVLIFWVFKE